MESAGCVEPEHGAASVDRHKANTPRLRFVRSFRPRIPFLKQPKGM